MYTKPSEKSAFKERHKENKMLLEVLDSIGDFTT